MRKVLVTGGAGFIGSHVSARLVHEGLEVVILDDLSSGTAAAAPAEAHMVVGSVLDQALMGDLLGWADACVHLAAVASVARCSEDAVGSHAVNLTAFVSLLSLLRERPGPIPLTYASSAAIYGDAAEPPLHEAMAPAPHSAYGADKLGCESHAAAARELFGQPSIGLRFFNVYGPGQSSGSPYSGVISRFHASLSAREPMVLHGDGRQTRDFIYVGDVVEAVWRSLVLQARPGACGAEVLNVCSGSEVSIADLGVAMARALDRSCRFIEAPSRPGDIRRSCGDPSRLRARLNFVPQTSLEAGLERLLHGDAAHRQAPRLDLATAANRARQSSPAATRGSRSR